MKKKALGKGIGALIPKKQPPVNTNNIVNVKTELVLPSRFQPRMNFDPQRHTELVASIREKGIMQPVIVRPLKGEDSEKGYELIAGERRLRAMKELGFEEIPVIIKDVKDADALELSLVENIQRQELNCIEEAHAYERLMNEFNLSQEEVAKAVGKDRSTISNTLRLLKLPKVIQDYVLRGTLSMGHARALLGLDESEKQIALAEKIAKNGISVRKTEFLVKRPSSIHKIRHKKNKDFYIKAAEEQLQLILGTKVTIIHANKRGKIIIEYYTSADMERIVSLLKR